MADRELFRAAARRLGLDTLTEELRERVGCGGCPAAEFLTYTRPDVLPGVRCRIEHNTMSVGTDPRTILRWCSQPSVASDQRNGYDSCPTWQFEKDRLALGLYSLGDEARLSELEEMTWREDVTGSPFGDLGIYDAASRAAARTIEIWQEQHAAGLRGE